MDKRDGVWCFRSGANSAVTDDTYRAGGGVIGCTCAYYLTRHPLYDRKTHSITIIEAVKIAAGSSGKAGGLLQIDAEPACISPLSFKLHAQLAEEYGGHKRWGYRRVHVGETDLDGRGGMNNAAATENYPSSLDWLLPSSIKSYKKVGTPEDSAQVHPYFFTTAVAEMAQEKGVKIIYGTVQGIRYNADLTNVEGVAYYATPTSQDIIVVPATDVIVAAGPWTSSIIPSVAVGGAKSHGVVIKPSRPISNNCLWASIKPGLSGHPRRSINLELYPRPDGTLYSCNWADADAVLPASSDLVDVDEGKCKEICDALGGISDELLGAEVLVSQAGHQPVILKEGRRAKNSGPLLGRTGVKGVLLATGHDSWGVQNAPATGLLASEVVFEGAPKSADICSLDPRTIVQKSLLV
ncbi:hypothetical protein AJ80_04406 [Polytolypa hystricis UAMH7299]|uniref:FAD dependent oxidoreductase domain-containing protein n=1 Tax=Polytolypa hystricis (strain UAMH7299) TaxID=1447883 RepID=A0A2B7YC43_POLH7|nr:hypothetical protein AJ80_04406 [Polytolypa hystricis UAMH7299]